MDRETLILAARRKLMRHTPFTDLVGVDVGKDTSYTDGWVFRTLDVDLGSPVDPENTGKSVVLISAWDNWATPNRHNTLRFPSLRFTVLADKTRLDPSGPGAFTRVSDSTARAARILEPIYDCFHDAPNRDHEWDTGVYIVTCVAESEPAFYSLPGTNGVTQGELRFSLEIG